LRTPARGHRAAEQGKQFTAGAHIRSPRRQPRAQSERGERSRRQTNWE
jgi:hypothetical protein